jgi:hypothetical protein
MTRDQTRNGNVWSFSQFLNFSQIIFFMYLLIGRLDWTLVLERESAAFLPCGRSLQGPTWTLSSSEKKLFASKSPYLHGIKCPGCKLHAVARRSSAYATAESPSATPSSEVDSVRLNSLPFMEFEVSLPSLRMHATPLFAEPHRLNAFLTARVTARRISERTLFALLIRATCRCRRVCSSAGIMLTGENWRTGGQTCPGATCQPQISHGLTWDRIQASAAIDRRLTAWAMARPEGCVGAVERLEIQSVPRSKHTLSRL